MIAARRRNGWQHRWDVYAHTWADGRPEKCGCWARRGFMVLIPEGTIVGDVCRRFVGVSNIGQCRQNTAGRDIYGRSGAALTALGVNLLGSLWICRALWHHGARRILIGKRLIRGPARPWQVDQRESGQRGR